jgi:hypothetical protein
MGYAGVGNCGEGGACADLCTQRGSGSGGGANPTEESGFRGRLKKTNSMCDVTRGFADRSQFLLSNSDLLGLYSWIGPYRVLAFVRYCARFQNLATSPDARFFPRPAWWSGLARSSTNESLLRLVKIARARATGRRHTLACLLSGWHARPKVLGASGSMRLA